MHRLLLITMLILISGCASDFGFQSQSQNVVSMREFNFKSGISGTVPPGLCQIKQLQSEKEGQGVVFFSNCNPHTNNKSLVTLTYLDLSQTQSEGLFNEDDFNNLFAIFQKFDDLHPMFDEKFLRISRVKENYIFMANYYVPKGRNLPNFRAKAYLNSILLSVKVPQSVSTEKVNLYAGIDPIPRPKSRPSIGMQKNVPKSQVIFENSLGSIPRPRKRPSIF